MIFLLMAFTFGSKESRMSVLRKKHITEHFSGAIGKTVVVKQYATKTVITAYPDMSKVMASAKQQYCKFLFKEAVAYAQSILNDPAQKAAYAAKLPAGRSVYHAALSEYLSARKRSI
jgi:hypothetical protein